MKRPSIFYGLIVAFGVALFVAVFSSASSVFFGGTTRVVLVATAATVIYLWHVLSARKHHAGKALVWFSIAAWICGSAIFSPNLGLFIWSLVALIWFARSIFAYSSLLSGLLDGGLCFIASGFAAFGFGWSGSLAVACWCFFLVQALWVVIPESMSAVAMKRKTEKEKAKSAANKFERAYQAAEGAVEQLAVRA